jgi:outer membrane lipoprotein-sorting protein
MKRFFTLIFGALVLLSTSAAAQQMSQAQADQKAQQLLNQYQADLELTIEQVSSFHKTISSYLMKRNEIENKSLAPAARKSALTTLSNEETSKMAAILNPHQLKLYKKAKPKVQPM